MKNSPNKRSRSHSPRHPLRQPLSRLPNGLPNGLHHRSPSESRFYPHSDNFIKKGGISPLNMNKSSLPIRAGDPITQRSLMRGASSIKGGCFGMTPAHVQILSKLDILQKDIDLIKKNLKIEDNVING
jgi:hypothetical protein